MAINLYNFIDEPTTQEYYDARNSGYKLDKDRMGYILKVYPGVEPGVEVESKNEKPEVMLDKYYLDKLLDGKTLEFIVSRFVCDNDRDADDEDDSNDDEKDLVSPFMGFGSFRIIEIIHGIDRVIKSRGLDLKFEQGDGPILHNFKQDYDKKCGLFYKDGHRMTCIEACDFIKIRFKINGNVIECHDLT